MRCLLFFLLIAFSYSAFSQTDYLVIHLKDNTSDTIAVQSIQTLKFEDPTNVNDPNLNMGLSNYPNPFSESTNIVFNLENPAPVNILIYNTKGDVVRKFNLNSTSKGKNQILWNTKDEKGISVPNGVYYYEVQLGTKVISKQMIKIK